MRPPIKLVQNTMLPSPILAKRSASIILTDKPHPHVAGVVCLEQIKSVHAQKANHQEKDKTQCQICICFRNRFHFGPVKAFDVHKQTPEIKTLKWRLQ